MSFTIGAQVHLKSGGPQMTVHAVDGESVTCVWFDKATRREAAFLAATLEQARDIGAILEEARKRANSTAEDA